MTTWASHHFDSCCSETVFPVPKPPGIAAVPPFAIGNRKSITRWPVMSGTLGIIRFFVGRGWRTGLLFHHQLSAAVKFRDDIVHLHVPGPDASDLPGHVRRDEDPVLDVFRLLDRPEDLASAGLRSFLYRGLEGPLLVATQTRRSNAPQDEIAHHTLQHRERTLHAVVDIPEQSGAQLDGERLTG